MVTDLVEVEEGDVEETVRPYLNAFYLGLGVGIIPLLFGMPWPLWLLCGPAGVSALLLWRNPFDFLCLSIPAAAFTWYATGMPLAVWLAFWLVPPYVFAWATLVAGGVENVRLMLETE